MKTCFKCGETKPIEMFYAHPGMPDGLLNKCKNCAKRDALDNYHRKIQNPSWKLSERQRNRLRIKAARAAGLIPALSKESRQRTLKLHRIKYPEKWRALAKTHRAMRTGVLIPQPCERCGTEKVQAHHDDYLKPLDVRWLCAPCHAAHHVAAREAELIQQSVA